MAKIRVFKAALGKQKQQREFRQSVAHNVPRLSPFLLAPSAAPRGAGRCEEPRGWQQDGGGPQCPSGSPTAPTTKQG